jgi:hypothetical protein
VSYDALRFWAIVAPPRGARTAIVYSVIKLRASPTVGSATPIHIRRGRVAIPIGVVRQRSTAPKITNDALAEAGAKWRSEFSGALKSIAACYVDEQPYDAVQSKYTHGLSPGAQRPRFWQVRA